MTSMTTNVQLQPLLQLITQSLCLKSRVKQSGACPRASPGAVPRPGVETSYFRHPSYIETNLSEPNQNPLSIMAQNKKQKQKMKMKNKGEKQAKEKAKKDINKKNF